MVGHRNNRIDSAERVSWGKVEGYTARQLLSVPNGDVPRRRLCSGPCPRCAARTDCRRSLWTRSGHKIPIWSAHHHMRVILLGQVLGSAEMVRMTVRHHDVLYAGWVQTEISQPVFDMGLGFVRIVQRIKEDDTFRRIHGPRRRARSFPVR